LDLAIGQAARVIVQNVSVFIQNVPIHIIELYCEKYQLKIETNVTISLIMSEPVKSQELLKRVSTLSI
jgi:hypothetical protein